MPADPTPEPETPAARGSRLISRLLPPAIRLWLHTQLDHIEGLEFAINGSDRQILAGHLPAVTVAARQAAYQGLYVSQVQVQATGIRVNLPQVLRGKALRLLQPFPVDGRVAVLVEDLRASLRSPLLGPALREALTPLLASAVPPIAATWLEQDTVDIDLGHDRLTLGWPGIEGDRLELALELTLEAGRCLCLRQPIATVRSPAGDPLSTAPLADITFDLGPEVDLRQLTVTPAGIDLVGAVRVIPAD
jgi:hypothetical protein